MKQDKIFFTNIQKTNKELLEIKNLKDTKVGWKLRLFQKIKQKDLKIKWIENIKDRDTISKE